MKLIQSIKNGFGSLKLRTKLILIIMIAIALPMAILAATLSADMYRMITSDTIREEQIAASQTAPILEESLENVRNKYSLIRNLAYSHTLFDGIQTEKTTDVLSSAETEAYSDTCLEQISDSVVTGIRLYVDIDKDDTFWDAVPENSILAPMDTIRTTYWYGIFSGSHVSELFCPPLYVGGNEKNTLGNCAFIKPVYIHHQNGSSTKCFLACYFDSSMLEECMTANLSQTGSVSYISNERDAMVATTDSALSGIYYMTYEEIQNSLMSSNGFLEKKILDESVYVSYYYLPTANWFMVTVIPTLPIQQKTTQTWWRIILIWLIAAMVTAIFAVFLSNSISRRISKVSEQMSHVKDGPPVPMESPTDLDEIGDLVDSYNYMARQINNLMEEQQKSAEELRVAEFNSLQAQINPHFLYNTMEMINWMAQQGRTKETNQAIRDLSRFYKLTLSRKNSITSIGEELEHVSLYAGLQNMRFDDGVDFVVDVPDTLLDYQIPRLTLQPIVENAILHGILEREDHKGTIVITGWLEDEMVVLLISDDGVGIPPEKLENILTEKAGSSGKGNQIAVYNTHRRLQILYGNDYGMHYSSVEGQGTEVEIRIPAIEM